MKSRKMKSRKMKSSIKTISSIMLLFIVIVIATFCRQKGTNRIEIVIDDMLDKTTDKEAAPLYKEIIKSKKQAIPYLIEKIDVKGEDYVGKLDTLDSNVFSWENCNGIQAAYVAELILSGANYNGQPILGKKGTSLFSRNIILKKSVRESLKYNDMVKVKVLYQQWWQRHRNEEIEELINDWNRGDRPLSNSVYEWY